MLKTLAIAIAIGALSLTSVKGDVPDSKVKKEKSYVQEDKEFRTPRVRIHYSDVRDKSGVVNYEKCRKKTTQDILGKRSR